MRGGELKSFYCTVFSRIEWLLLVWMFAFSFLSVCWLLSPWHEVCRYSGPCALPGWWGQACRLLSGLIMTACAWLWSPQWGQQLAPASRAHASSVLLPGSIHRERSSYGGPAPLLMHPPIMVHASQVGPGFFRAHPQLPQPSLLRLCLHSQPQSSPWVWPLKSVSAPAPTHTNR